MADPSTIDVPLPTHTVHALTWGPDDGRLVVALHGFPDSAHTWRHLGPYLAERGFRVVAPFTRGYAPSGVPSDHCYTIGALMADAVALHAALDGGPDAALVGHDWGALTANGLAAHPDSPFGRVVSMAVPPLALMGPSRDQALPWLNAVARQPRKSWYIALNQLPGVSESRLDRLVPYLWRTWSPGYDGADDVALTLDTVPDPEHARAIVAYYRAFVRPGPGARTYRGWHRTFDKAPIAPTLYLHGAQDGCLEPRFLPLVAERMPAGSRAELVDDVGHFLQVERPDVVNALVADWLTG